MFAIDARTGKQRWRHDPQVPREHRRDRVLRRREPRRRACIAGACTRRRSTGGSRRSTRETGAVVWSVMTVDPTRPYTITMAPRVVKGKVIIGNGGAELGVRGYVSAYDAETGAQVWRFYTVPGDPAQPYETPELAAAAKTWDPVRRVLEGRRRRHGLERGRVRSRRSTCSTSAPATGRPGASTSAARRAATISTSLRSSRCAPTPGSSSGTTRRRPATTGTTRRRRTSCSPISRSTARRARC